MALVAILDSHRATAHPEVLCGPSAATERRLKAATELLAPYRPFPGTRNRHASTILASMFRTKPGGVHYRREVVRMKDSGCVTLDWLVSQDGPRGARADAPLLILLSGIAGGSADAYVQHMVADAAEQGFRPVCFNSRGCAGGPLTVPQFYSASFTNDLREVVALLAKRHPDVPRLALGWSLGANILVNYIGEEGAAGGAQLLDGAVSVGNPFNLVACDEAMGRGMGRIYSRNMVRPRAPRNTVPLTPLRYRRGRGSAAFSRPIRRSSRACLSTACLPRAPAPPCASSTKPSLDARLASTAWTSTTQSPAPPTGCATSPRRCSAWLRRMTPSPSTARCRALAWRGTRTARGL